ncbi:MAG: transposase [Gammaproteobacteria bacterium]|nr:transposase [Gammaproteobacteria bacterium]
MIQYLIRWGVLAEDQGQLYLDQPESTDPSMTPLQASSCTYRIALGPRAGQKLVTLQTVEPNATAYPSTGDRCVNRQGFSLHANTYCAPTDRQKLERLCRYITRPALANGSARTSLCFAAPGHPCPMGAFTQACLQYRIPDLPPLPRASQDFSFY